MTGTAQFDRLIRFVAAEDGKTYYGDLKEAALPAKEIVGKEVELLCPLERTPIVLCVGLNYRQHAEECNLTIPTYPAIFTKPADALAGPLTTIPIHKDCTSQLDYEGELTFVFARDAKNVPADQFQDYLLGYTIGNDVSARNFQLPASVSGGQFGYAKGFDSFAPIGPAIVATRLVPDPQALRLATHVNGQQRQATSTDDMIWTVGQIVEHLTRGTTVRRGTVVMTGTPSGVGLFMSPQGFLGDGDEVVVSVEGLGALGNRVVFEKE